MTTAVFDNDAFVMPSFAGSFVAHLALLIATAAAAVPARVQVDDALLDQRLISSNHPWPSSENFGMTTLRGASHEERSMGDLDSSSRESRYGVSGPADNPDPHLAYAAGRTDSSCSGCIGIIGSVDAGDMHAPRAHWGKEDSLGQDPESARGQFWGDAIGDAAGSSSAGVRGDGEENGYGDGSSVPFPNYVHRCRLQ